MSIKEIIDARNSMHAQNNKKRLEAFEKWTSPAVTQRYMPAAIIEALNKALDVLTEDEAKANILFNGKLKAECADLVRRQKVKYYPDFSKPADYSAQVANALTTIKLLDTSLTYEDAKHILAPFVDDYDQMLIFRRIFENLEAKLASTENDGLFKFSNLFTKVETCRLALVEAEECSKLAEELFMYNKLSTDRIFNSHAFAVSLDDGYDEIDGQERMLAFASKLAG